MVFHAVAAVMIGYKVSRIKVVPELIALTGEVFKIVRILTVLSAESIEKTDNHFGDSRRSAFGSFIFARNIKSHRLKLVAVRKSDSRLSHEVMGVGGQYHSSNFAICNRLCAVARCHIIHVRTADYHVLAFQVVEISKYILHLLGGSARYVCPEII